jgi:uncharacterized membrane protein (UPF0127 family)
MQWESGLRTTTLWERMSAPAKLIVNLTRGNVVGERVVIADRLPSRMRGVLGRSTLRPGHGLLLQPALSIHTWFVRFNFDAVFLDRNLQVVRIVSRLKPWRIESARHAASVLELAAGEAERRRVEVGDQLVISDTVPAAALPTIEGGGEVHAARLLLIGSDRRFRSTAAILLARRGYDVAVSARATSLAEQASEHRAEVIVLDAGSLAPVAALEIARLEGLSPSVGCVVVSDDRRPAALISTVPKWGSLDDLSLAIEGVRPHHKSAA